MIVRTAAHRALGLRLVPRVQIRSPLEGPLPEKHLAVLPDCPQTFARTPAQLAVWPDMWPPLDADTNYPDLLSNLGARSSETLNAQFVPLQASDDLTYYFLYGTRVRAFVVEETP